MSSKNLISTLALSALAALGFNLITSSSFAAPPAGTQLAEKQVLQLAIRANPRSIDPNQQAETIGNQISNQLFKTLVIYDEHDHIIPGAAESWSANADSTVWTFNLRKNAKWSDGTPVTAKDFVASWRRLVDPKNAFVYAFQPIDSGIVNAAKINKGELPPDQLGVKALDDYTLEVTLENPLPWFFLQIALSPFAPVPAHLLVKGWPQPTNLVSNGPFKLAKYVPNEKFELVKNDQYWDKDNVVLTDIVYKVQANPEINLANFKAGELSVTGLSSDQINDYKAAPGEKLVSQPAATVNWVGINQAKPALQDVRVRKALVLGLDYHLFQTSRVRRGGHVTSIISSPALPGFNQLKEQDWWQVPYATRAQQANQLLAEAGYSESNPLKLTYDYSSGDEQRRTAVALQQLFKKTFGNKVELKLQNQEWSSFLNKRQQGNVELYAAGFSADYADLAGIVTIWTSYNPNNDSGFKSKAYDDTYAQLALTPKLADRAPLYQKLINQLYDNAVVIPTGYANANQLVQENLQGWNTDVMTYRAKHIYFTKPSK